MKTLIVALYPYNGQSLDAWHDHGAGMTYAAAKAAGCDVSFLDLKIVKDDADLKEKLKGYDLVGFGLKSSYYPIGMKVAKVAKENGSKTIIGGYHITAAPTEIEQELFDYIFHGESELTFPQFLKDPSKFERDIYGEKVPDLDSLPWIDRTIYRDTLENCSFWWHGGQRRKMLSVISARGCPFQCAFCQPLEDNHFGRKLRRRSVDSLIAELKWLKDLHHPDCLMIHDDTFFVQPKWIEEFIEKYPQIGLPFWAAARADGICEHPELFKKLVKVGWELISVGYESGSQRILDKIKKGTTVEQNLEATKIIRTTKAKIYANYILGFPWETRWDIQETMKMADKIKAEMPSWAFFTPYPGCELSKECVDNGWSLLNRSSYDRCPSGKKVLNVDYEYVNKALKGLREDLPQLVCDIIIPSYENEQYTVNCINSIKRYTKPGTYRIIWVDNGSSSTANADSALEDTDHISIKLPKNLGFVGAVNKGLEQSDAPNVCFLNNDTVVTPRWMDKLLKSLYSATDIGIVGPITGWGGDSQHSLDTHRDLLPKESHSWTIEKINSTLESKYPGGLFQLEFVAFLCAIIKREVINKVGKLDENYAMGMWDDLDWNRAAHKNGYRSVLSLDTCIYHRGRTTFNLLQKTEDFDVRSLWQQNRVYLSKKWRDNMPSEPDLIIVSRAIYDEMGDTTDPGILGVRRLEIMQRYFINSLKNQVNQSFVLYMVVGSADNEATKRIEGLNWDGVDVEFIYTNADLSIWKNSTKNKGLEVNEGSPEEVAKHSGHPLSRIMARLDTDDWVAPGWTEHMKYMADNLPDEKFLINYQVIGQSQTGLLYHFDNLHTKARTSPFIALVQKNKRQRISPYHDSHLRMGRYFDHVYTIPPSYAYMVVHGENRSNRVYPKDRYYGIPGHILTLETGDATKPIASSYGDTPAKVVHPPHARTPVPPQPKPRPIPSEPTRIVHRPGVSPLVEERMRAQMGRKFNSK